MSPMQKKAGRPLEYKWTTTEVGSSFILRDRTTPKGRTMVARRYNAYKAWREFELRHKTGMKWIFEQRDGSVKAVRVQ